MKHLSTIQCSMLPKLRVICFAHAGGGASAFADWKGRLPSSVEIYAVQLPAREARLRDAMPINFAALLDDVLQTIRPLLNKPFVFYGQSMGALLAFEMTRFLRRSNLPMPQQLLLAARRAPQLPDRYMKMAELPDQAFITELDARYGGMALLLANPAMWELSLPALRGDITLAEQYQFIDEPQLDLPLHVFYGTRDSSLDAAAAAAWQQMTTNVCSVNVIEGGHFLDEAGRISLWQLLSELLSGNKKTSTTMHVGWQHG